MYTADLKLILDYVSFMTDVILLAALTYFQILTHHFS